MFHLNLSLELRDESLYQKYLLGKLSRKHYSSGKTSPAFLAEPVLLFKKSPSIISSFAPLAE
jgi:hypothetical protein